MTCECFVEIFELLKKLLTNDTFISYFEIVIEIIFLFFVVKEFKVTRKSFEWQKEERNEKLNKLYLYYFNTYN